MSLKLAVALSVFSQLDFGLAASWASLNVSVPPVLMGTLFVNLNYVDVLLGSPPQLVSLIVDYQSSTTSVIAQDCPLCPQTNGNIPFSCPASTTCHPSNTSYISGNYSGNFVSDIVGFGRTLQAANTNFALVHDVPTALSDGRLPNGNLGLAAAPSSSENMNILSQLYTSGQLIDPVIGMRLDSEHPKMTIGALDPNDYVGTINWVQIEESQSKWNLSNRFPIDGILGRNGSVLKFDSSEPLLASLDSTFINIAVPDNATYYHDWGQNASRYFYSNDVCFNGTVSVVINGVTYPVKTEDILRPDAASESCSRGIIGNPTTDPPAYILGMPFLRSVYVAYRFATDDCPGFFGFAFPSGTTPPPSQASQAPTSTPSLASQCLALTTPTSTPIPSFPGVPVDNSPHFAVYGQDGVQVQLKGTEALKKGVWSVLNTGP